MTATRLWGLVVWAATLVALQGCSGSSNPQCSLPAVWTSSACGTCVDDTCDETFQSACPGFSSCYCSCISGADATALSCTSMCTSSSCTGAVGSCVIESIDPGGACADTCGTSGAAGSIGAGGTGGGAGRPGSGGSGGSIGGASGGPTGRGGTSGPAGQSGSNGAAGQGGTNGAAGQGGIGGPGGQSGASGARGQAGSGASGASGTSGAAGVNGGGGQGGAGGGGLACNGPPMGAAQSVSEVVTSNSLPMAVGNTIAAGTYYLTSCVVYNGTADASTFQVTSSISSTSLGMYLSVNTVENDSGFTHTSTTSYETEFAGRLSSGYSPVCGMSNIWNPGGITFDATSTEFTIYNSDAEGRTLAFGFTLQTTGS
jgi:hypothetical protein